MPYPFEWDDNKELYIFTTSKSINYELSFVEDNLLNYEEPTIENIYQFVLVKVGSENESNSYDVEIAPTVRNVINAFFQNKPNSTLIYSCDNYDGKGRCRSIIFNRWFREFSIADSKYTKIDSKIVIPESSTIYSSLILHQENDQYDLIVERQKMIEEFYKDDM